ncbi:SUKH-3 domain-containing protein [Chitinophaga sp. Cy-1792]|uniref:SUKH-3 domain-containing protein n=1 Tax=Chitinophaga sp. Cy-1792 TaxID=2608339 RepID=UPI001423B00C|nr:SUKH-3 domain-containing protein [Chitinophaga sp. Cy-1792]NIG55723.1 hypothetical protein [Chitinophaga sp. Cy-1792]
MLLPNTPENLEMVLKAAGWYEGRNIRSTLANTLAFHMYPENVQAFLSEFGELHIKSAGIVYGDYQIPGIKQLNDVSFVNNVKRDIYLTGNEWDKNNQSDVYYYSLILGVQLHDVGHIKTCGPIYLDDKGNFYLHDFLNNLYWVADAAPVAFAKLFFGSIDMAIFHEGKWRISPETNLDISHLPVSPDYDKIDW